jgi:DNA-binding NarL/FixJ family response regulator
MGNGSVDGAAVRVLVADSTRMGTQLILEVLRQDNRFIAVGVPAAPAEIGARVTDFKPNVVVIGVRANGNARADLDLLWEKPLREANIRAVLLLEASTHDMVVNAFRAGARGVICRDDGLDALRKCIYAVHWGQIWANSSQLGYLLEVFSRRWVPETIVDSQGRSLLSKRELDVVRCVSEGMTNREIALHLNLSEHTVKNYIFRTFDKLGVSNRAELVLYAINHGCAPQPVGPVWCEQCSISTRVVAPAPPLAARQPTFRKAQEVSFASGAVRRPRDSRNSPYGA